MEERPLTVRRTVTSLELLAAGRAGDLLNFLRREVAQVRLTNPLLKDYRLHDVGFVPKGTRVELRFYFLRGSATPVPDDYDPE
ncbi:MAG: hypothetical protein ACYC5Y_07365 [Symbiobacteriia bacterium]